MKTLALLLLSCLAVSVVRAETAVDPISSAFAEASRKTAARELPAGVATPGHAVVIARRDPGDFPDACDRHPRMCEPRIPTYTCTATDRVGGSWKEWTFDRDASRREALAMCHKHSRAPRSCAVTCRD